MKTKLLIIFVFFFIIAVILFSSFVGPTLITLKSLRTDRTINYIFFNMRIPRVLLGFFTGIILSVSGLVFQSLFRNPLVSPFTLGISSAASAGVFLSIKIGVLGFYILFFTSGQIFAVLFSLFSIFLVYFISVKRGEMDLNTALLAGISLNFLFSAFILILHFLSTPEESFTYFKWIFGSLETSGYSDVIIFLILSIILVFFFLLISKELDLFSVSEEVALSKGVNVRKVKLFSFVLISLVVSTSVSFTGPIAFVGLMVPHIAKAFKRFKHQELIIIAAILGGVMIVLADAIARTIVAPAEIPIGIIMTIFGVPFMIYLINSKKR